MKILKLLLIILIIFSLLTIVACENDDEADNDDDNTGDNDDLADDDEDTDDEAEDDSGDNNDTDTSDDDEAEDSEAEDYTPSEITVSYIDLLNKVSELDDKLDTLGSDAGSYADTLDEIEDAYNILKGGTDRIGILHCISSYPTMEKDSNLSNIYKIQEKYDCIVGQSDHTNDIKVPIYAAAAGAQILEKHFKIDEEFECIDSPVSITETQMKGLVEEVRGLEKIFGDENFGLREAEKGIEIFRRSS